MKKRKRSPDDPQEWLNRAKSSLALARTITPDIYFEDLCFQAQQAAEKALKAVFIINGISYPYTHDINALLSVLEDHRISIPEQLWTSVTLTSYAADTRYPGFDPPVTKDEYLEALALAEEVIRWVAELVG
jgi:HEPN domain-containing protein